MTQSLSPQTDRSYVHGEWQRGYESQTQEDGYWLEAIAGEIPQELQGTLFRNGPGLLDVGGEPIKHPFDGDGMVTAIAFEKGRAYCQNRFVRTEGFVAEQAAEKILYRGVFGTQKPGGFLKNMFDLKPKNIANTNVSYWGQKLLALWEGGLPHRLNPENLDTIGPDYLNGILQENPVFSAHPHIDPACEMDGGAPCFVNFGIKPGPTSTIFIYEFNPQGELLRSQKQQIPGFAFIHDFMITPNYCLFLQNAVGMNILPFVLGLKGAGECLDFKRHQPSKLLIVPRKPPYSQKKAIAVDAGFVFHHGNAYEEDGKIILDSICYDEISPMQDAVNYKDVNFDTLAPGLLWRLEVDLAKETVTTQRLSDRSVEFPCVHPQWVGRKHRYLYLAASHHRGNNAPLQAIAKYDLHTRTETIHSFAPHGYASEPIFVPHPQGEEEDQGWLLTLIYNGEKHISQLVILDAQHLEQGAIATLDLKYHIPHGLHGSWTSEVFYPRGA